MKIVSIVGARPQFVKVAVICRAIGAIGEWPIAHRIIHTGQHYDSEMSSVFFQDLGIDVPAYHLDVGSGSHGEQTGEMLKRLEPVLMSERPDWILLYGDTNSTLAGAVAGSKMGLRVAHVEAGLRSYNRRMPEELNRIATDHLSDLLLCPTAVSVENLRKEGLGERSVLTGDVMLDAVLASRDQAEARTGVLAETWQADKFALATVHRAENTDDPSRLRSIFIALERIAEETCPVVLPLHPRTRKCLALADWTPRAINVIAPCSYLDMILLEARAKFILTDSGGVQKEAYFVETPCVTLREETEWTETLANNCNVLVGADTGKIVNAARMSDKVGPWTAVYGDGQSGKVIVEALRSWRG
jgi:UDP-GlcNAc3NAcA epimerase